MNKALAIIQCTASDLYESINPDDYCVSALKESGMFEHIILAVPKIGNYKIFNALSKLWDVDVYFGENYNVAERLYNASRRYNPYIVARVLLKRFYIDFDLVEHMIKKLCQGYDYINLGNDVNYEVAADIFSFSALERAVKLLRKSNNSYSSYIYRFSPWALMEQHPEFKVYTIHYQKMWDKNRVINVKKKLKYLSIGDENKYALSVNNPANRYRFSSQFVEKNDTVLDIACGQGRGSALLAQVAKKVYGIDYNKYYITKAQKEYKNLAVTFLHGTDELLDELDIVFNKVVSLHTMEHVDDDELFLNRINKSLSKKGRLILEVPRFLSYPLCEPLYPFHKREYKRMDLEKLLKSVGFEIVIALGGNRNTYIDIEEAREVLFYVCRKMIR